MSTQSRSRRINILAAGTVLLVVILPVIVPSSSPDLTRLSTPPSLHHPLGTSPDGSDLLRLSLLATRQAGLVAMWAAVLTVALGASLGAFAALSPGSWLDHAQATAARLFDAMGPLLPTICIASVAPGLGSYSIALFSALCAWPPVSAVVRGEIIHESRQSYISAAKAIGVGRIRLVRHYYLPAMLDRLIPWCFGLFSGYVALFGALGFLGAGRGSDRSLGFLLFDSISHLHSAPWYFWSVLLHFSLLLAVAAPFANALLANSIANPKT